MIENLYLPGELQICSSYLLRHKDITSLQMPIMFSQTVSLIEFSYESKLISSGQFEIGFETDGQLLFSVQLTNGEAGWAFLPNNLVLPNLQGLSVLYIKNTGDIADLQIQLVFKEFC